MGIALDGGFLYLQHACSICEEWAKRRIKGHDENERHQRKIAISGTFVCYCGGAFSGLNYLLSRKVMFR